MALAKLPSADIYYQLIETPSAQGTLLFIHGSGSTHEVWEDQLNLLPKGYNGIALDLPRHGKSTGTPCKSIEEFAQIIIQFLDFIRLPHPVYLCGHSLGAAITLQVARFFPHYIDGIIICGGSSKMRVYPQVLQDLSVGIINPDFIEVTFAPMTDPMLSQPVIKSFLQFPPDVFYHDLNSCDKFDITAELAEIEKPTLVISAQCDRLTPVKQCKKLTVIRDSTFVIIEDAGHFMIIEKPRAVNSIISDWLEQRR